MPFAPVRLPSGRWQGGFRHPVTRRKVTRTFDYQYEAEGWSITAEERARAAGAEGAREVPPAPPPEPMRWTGPSVADYGYRYLDRRRGTLERATREKYDAWLSGLGREVRAGSAPLGAVPMGLLTREAVQDWIAHSRDAGVGVPTINGRLRLLRMLYADLLDSDEPPAVRNPTRGLDFLTEDQDPVRDLAEEEVDSLLAHAPAQLASAALVALDAGLRWQEAYALRASAVKGSYLLVSHVIVRGQAELRAFTKGKRVRAVPTTDRLAGALEPLVTQAQRRGGRDALLFPAVGDPERTRKDRRADLVAGRIPWQYANHRKREWLPTLLSMGAAEEEWKETGRTRADGQPILQRRLVAAEFGFHALRHTYGSRLAAAGVPRHEIAELMGHADERMTGNYIHAGVDGRRLELVRQALGRAS